MKGGWIVFFVALCLATTAFGYFTPMDALTIGQNDVSSGGLGKGASLSFDQKEAKDVPSINIADEAPTISSLSESGSYSRTFNGEGVAEKEEMLADLGFCDSTEVMSFLTESPLISLQAPLSVAQLSDLFFLIVAFSEDAFSMQGRLEMISIVKSGERFVVYGEIDLSLDCFRKKTRAELLPERAKVDVYLPFCIKNTELSVDYEEILIRCDKREVSEMMLSFVFAPNVGDINCTKLFADAVGNVIRNACFSG